MEVSGTEYHKINSIFKRDPETHKLIIGDYSMPEFEYLADLPWEFTEKVDGTNIRVVWHANLASHGPELRQVGGGSLRFTGRTDGAVLHKDLLQRLHDLFDGPAAERKSIFDCDHCCLYGEGFGPGIQKGGGNYGTIKDFVLFDVRVGHTWLTRDNVVDISAALGLQVVPSVGEGPLIHAVRMVQEGLTSGWGDFEAEGIVARPKVELRDRRGNRIIAKIKGCDFEALP